MRESLFACNGLDEEGIFRVAGDELEVASTKNKINKNEFTSSKDAHTLAALIKIWFRELPVPIMDSIPSEVILQVH